MVLINELSMSTPMATERLDADLQGPTDQTTYRRCKDDCKRTSGGLQFLGGKLVSWSSKKQDCTAMSTAEAEYVSLSACCAQVIWMRTQLLDYGFSYTYRMSMYCDSRISSLDFQEEVDAGAEQVNTASAEQVNTASAEQVNTASAEQVSTAEGVNTGSIKLSTGNEQVSTVGTKESTSSQDKGQREGKAPMISEETPKKSKEQILQEEASLAEAIRLDSLQKEEEAKQIHLDSLLAQRIAEEEELNEEQKKRKAQVQFEAQHYTNEDWDLIRAKIEANAELSKSMLGSELQGEDFAKKMVDLVNQRKKYFAEERARAKRNKPMTQSQLM
ncbi:hypothetical protein Tco_0054547 [Tanacetum coccineum]